MDSWAPYAQRSLYKQVPVAAVLKQQHPSAPDSDDTAKGEDVVATTAHGERRHTACVGDRQGSNPRPQADLRPSGGKRSACPPRCSTPVRARSRTHKSHKRSKGRSDGFIKEQDSSRRKLATIRIPRRARMGRLISEGSDGFIHGSRSKTDPVGDLSLRPESTTLVCVAALCRVLLH